VHPQLRGREFDVVDEEHLALAARREIRDHRARHQHLDAAADHRLEELEARGELHEVELDVVLREIAAVDSGPDLAVDRQRVQVADLHLRAALRDGRHTEHADARAEAHRGACLQELPAIHSIFFLHGAPLSVHPADGNIRRFKAIVVGVVDAST